MLKTDGEVFTGNSFATLIDTSATMVKDNQKDIDVPHGIVTDIFPMDGCPDGKFKRYLLTRCSVRSSSVTVRK